MLSYTHKYFQIRKWCFEKNNKEKYRTSSNTKTKHTSVPGWFFLYLNVLHI